MAKEVVKDELLVTEKGMALINALRELGNECTTEEVAAHMGVDKRAVVGSMNALVKRGIAVRNEVQAEVDGKPATIKFLSLTDFGATGEFHI